MASFGLLVKILVQGCLSKNKIHAALLLPDKKDEKELEEYIRNVSIILAPAHYLLLDAKQRLAGVIRDTINREMHPTKRLIRRKIELCEELLDVLEKLSPGISRTKGWLPCSDYFNRRETDR